MSRQLTLFARLALLLLAALAEPRSHGQGSSASRKLLLHADMNPGDTLRYELEAAGSFLPIADASGAILTPPRGPCDYSLASIVTLRAQAPDKDGNIPVEAKYSDTRVSSVRCALFSAPDFQKRLAALQSSTVMFRVGPHGETALSHTSDGYFKYWDGGELLRKVTQDLLQTQFSPQPVAAGASWKPRGQFAYPHDRALKDLELSGADLRFRNLVKVDGRSCAWVTSQYVFSPIDLPAVGTASGGRVVPAAGTTRWRRCCTFRCCSIRPLIKWYGCIARRRSTTSSRWHRLMTMLTPTLRQMIPSPMIRKTPCPIYQACGPIILDVIRS